MKIDFAKVSPAGNVTILVLSPVDRKIQPQVAAALMKSDSVSGEQVGFLEKPNDTSAAMRLNMMGGEFCANATMALASWLARRDGVCDRAYSLEISGCASPLSVAVTKDDSGYLATVPMPLPARVESVAIQNRTYPLVRLMGISHAILPIGIADKFGKDDIRALSHSVDDEAFGLMFYENGRMRPFVYVKPTDTAVWESACGSGSAAVAAYLASLKGESLVTISQPGGRLTASARFEKGEVTGLRISVKSQITVEGSAYVSLS